MYIPIGLICLCYLCFQGIVPTIRREDGGIMPVLIPIWTVCGTKVGITAAAIRMGSTGLSSEEELILWKKWPWWWDPMEIPSNNCSVCWNLYLTRCFHQRDSVSQDQAPLVDFQSFFWLLYIHNAKTWQNLFISFVLHVMLLFMFLCS